eukprot:COSAG01_NODE_6270_length_3761_cov_20.095576_6_plen_182_part_00
MDKDELNRLKAELATRQANIQRLRASIASRESAPSAAFPYSASNLPGRVLVSALIGTPDGGASLEGKVVSVGGWVRTGREQGNRTFAFLEINDGSHFRNLQVCSLPCPGVMHSPRLRRAILQVIVNADVHELKPLLAIGTAVGVQGKVVRPVRRVSARALLIYLPSLAAERKSGRAITSVR